ncbi:hypothetical protein FQA39_LY15718 [Lamprigera yunnana]|nr:hypothetical protein FQA39_LY15718 [Lamprigera yunnana]
MRFVGNQSSSEYSNLNTTDTLWRQISSQFPNRNEQELRKKWQILRTGYRTRRGEKYLPSGSGAKPIKKWVYFDSLMFLESYMTERNTSTNLKKVSNNTTNRSLCNNVSSQSYAKAYMLNDDGILVSDEAEERDQNTEENNSQTNPHVDDETYSPSERRDLYDQSSSEYSNLNTTDTLWRQISSQFPNRNEQELRKKWQILRTGYRTRRGEKYLPSGSGAKPIKKWVYFDSLMFLESYMTERNTSTNLKKVSNNTTNRSLCNNVSSQSYAKAYMLNDDGILVSDEAEESDQNTEEYNSQTNPHVDDETYSPSVSDAPSTPEGPTSGSRKKRKSKLNPVDERFLTFFEKKHESTAKREKSSNELFLASLLEDMNKLQQDDLRKFKIIMLTAPEPFNSRIVGGHTAEDGQFPFQIAITYNNQHSCGGSILDIRTVLTAANCIEGYDVKDMTVVVGTNKNNAGGVTHSVSSVVYHSEFTLITARHDIGLIKLDSEISFNEKVQPIELNTDYIGENVECVVSGWGFLSFPGTSSVDLQYIALSTYSNKICKIVHDLVSVYDVYDTHICTFTKYGKGPCKGDSGGPLVANNKQIGIVSWALPCARGAPDVFTRVTSYVDWIAEHI